MNILVTGGAGFIGSNFIKYMLDKYDKEIKIVNIDLLTYAGNKNNLKEIYNDKRYTFIKGDICNKHLLKDIFNEHEIDKVINFAAESHVDRSIENPDLFLKTNIIGTQTLLETAKNYWKIKENKYSTEFKKDVKFVQISTDEVYGSLDKEGLFTEETKLNPSNPYSVSKASADMMVNAYHVTYGLPMNITRCSNNYGPNQFPEKLIPLMIINALKNKPLPIYGDGKQIRDWIYVKDHCIAIDVVLEKGKNGEVYNIGGNNEEENIQIVKIILSKLGKNEKLIKHVTDRLGHDRRYALDNSKINNELGWEPTYKFEDGIDETIKWYMSYWS